MDRERQRRLSVEGRLADLGGTLDAELACGPDLPPTWGALGGLARVMLPPTEYAHLLVLHEHEVELARQRRGLDHDQPAPAGASGATVRALTTPAVPIQSPPVAPPEVNVSGLDV